MPPVNGFWPELPYEAWRDTRETLHRYVQIAGRVRQALAPPEPQWLHVPLYVTARGLTTSPMPHPNDVFDIDFDFVDHVVAVRPASAKREQIRLEPRTVADFHAELMDALARAGVPTEIEPTPSEVPDLTPFAEDVAHASYDPSWANTFWRALATVDAVLKEHRARSPERVSPVQLWWGSLDLAYIRFGEASSSAGFWAGDERLPAPAFYAYTTPKPDGIESAARWDAKLGELILPYDEVRAAADSRAALLAFLDEAYAAGGDAR